MREIRALCSADYMFLLQMISLGSGRVEKEVAVLIGM